MIRLAAICALLGTAANGQQAVDGTGGDFRVLDKVTGAVSTVTMTTGQTEVFGQLSLRLEGCRYPQSNPSGDAYANVTIYYGDALDPVFQGWMLASSPALNALDHPRYDVWVLRCNTS